MIAEIVSVGTELLMGQVVNTDAQFIATYLAPLGFQVYYHTTVGDNRDRLKEATRRALERSDVVLFTGGLGPTDDDLTKETVADALSLPLVPIAEEMERLEQYFTQKGRQMTPNNRKQACFPENAVILPNPNGTAPGCMMQKDGKTAILLPGPPRELQPMFVNHVVPQLGKMSGFLLVSRELRSFGVGEADLTYRIRDIISGQTNPTVAPYIKPGEVTLRVTAKCQTREEGERLMRPMIGDIVERLGDAVYSTNGESLPETCARLLVESDLTLAAAESCTGGMIASMLVDVAGCSRFLKEACVTYSDEAKMRRLNVSFDTLKRHTAVSEPCAIEMAEGMLRSSGAEIALATTGYAGPDGGTQACPVGTVFLALADRRMTVVKRLTLHGDRARIRMLASMNAFDMLRRKLCT